MSESLATAVRGSRHIGAGAHHAQVLAQVARTSHVQPSPHQPQAPAASGDARAKKGKLEAGRVARRELQGPCEPEPPLLHASISRHLTLRRHAHARVRESQANLLR